MRKLIVLLLFAILIQFDVKSQITWVKGGNNAGPPGSQPIIGTNNTWNSPLQFYTFGIHRMQINDNTGSTAGFVGIGNAFITPQSLLHIHDGGLSYLQVTNLATTNAANMGVRFGLFGPQAHAVIAQQTPGFNMYFSTNGPSAIVSNIKMVITPTGLVGIGSGGFVSPNNRLDVDAGDIDINTPQNSYMIGDSSVLHHKGAGSNLFMGVGAGQNHLVSNYVYNILIGHNTGFNLVGGANGGSNIMIGANAGFNYINQEKSVLIGTEAGYNMNSSAATYIGYRAGFSDINTGSGTGNTYIGFESGLSGTTPKDNTFCGSKTGRLTTTGDNNSFFGLSAGSNNTTGSFNCFFGNLAGGNNGIFNRNNCIGVGSGNTGVGEDNVFVGNQSGNKGVGNKNVVLGNDGMPAAINSDENVAIGYQSGNTGTSNNFNFLGGSQSAPVLVNSDRNTFIGYKTAFNQTGGFNNTYLGETTGNNVQTGTNNTFIGSRADVTNITPVLNNAAAIGANAKVTNDNHMILGDNSVNVGIGLSGDPAGPLNKLEISTGTGPVPGSSGLKFRDLNSTSTAGANPGTGVLSVDLTGNVIYVTGGSGGPGFGNLCGSPQNPITNHFEMPLGNSPNAFSYYFTGQNLANDKVSVGFPCNTLLRGRLNSLQEIPTIHLQETISGYFLNRDVNGDNRDTLVGAFGQASGIQPAAVDNVNIGGSFYALHARTNIGVQGIGMNTIAQPIAPTNCFGGRFAGLTSPNTNYGVWATANGPAGSTNYAGYFQGDVFVNGGTNSGTGYLVASDQMFKTNVDTIANIVSVIDQLKPRTFYFDTTNLYGVKFSSKKQYGLIAQDVQTILPELVGNITKPAEYDSLGNIITPTVTYKNLNYDAFIAILIKGMQIQQRQNEKQDSLITTLQNQINNLTTSVTACCSNTNVRTTTPAEQNQLTINLSDKDIIVLNQNVPNPFAEQTTITYNVPEQYGYAQMIFTTVEGRILKAVDITKKGRGQVNVYSNDLSSGMYMYSLIVDGKTIDTKKMVKGDQ
jgi:hypothetical protein